MLFDESYSVRIPLSLPWEEVDAFIANTLREALPMHLYGKRTPIAEGVVEYELVGRYYANSGETTAQWFVELHKRGRNTDVFFWVPTGGPCGRNRPPFSQFSDWTPAGLLEERKYLDEYPDWELPHRWRCVVYQMAWLIESLLQKTKKTPGDDWADESKPGAPRVEERPDWEEKKAKAEEWLRMVREDCTTQESAAQRLGYDVDTLRRWAKRAGLLNLP